MASVLKTALYTLSRQLGLFHLARHATRNQLRILCYHGSSLRDESRFRPELFIEPATFDARLRFLREHGFPVLPLAEALERLEEGTLPAGATVITLDDG